MTYDKPTGYCVKCHHPHYHFSGKCSRPIGINKMCMGGIRSALGPDDWKVCSSCNGTKRTETGSCLSCAGTGWVCTRPY